MTDVPPEPAIIAIKKYPNRRYYDSSQSCHVTLEDIHRMICAGNQVQVTDSKTDTDITSLVLAQILLEMDSLKLVMFPSPLLHKLIQSNETIVQEFVEVYFSKALYWFLTSRQVFEDQFRRAVGLGAMGSDASPIPPKFSPQQLPVNPVMPHTQPPTAASAESATSGLGLHERVEQLSKRVENLQAQLLSARPGKA